jgi:hypothetical protein
MTSDRSAWIVLAGIVEVALGAGCLLLVRSPGRPARDPAGAQEHRGGPQLPIATVATTSVVYAIFAVFFVWVGIGTVRKRRWARTLMLSAAWVWLLVGVGGAVMLAFGGLPGTAAAEGDQALVNGIVRFVAIALGLVFYVVLPLFFVLFLRSGSVRFTFEASDPVPRWTDRCPGPVLSMILTLAYCAVGCLVMLAWNVASSPSSASCSEALPRSP